MKPSHKGFLGVRSHVYCHRFPRTFVLSREILQQIFLNIFSGLVSQEKLKNLVASFAALTISLLSIVALLIAGT